MLMQVRVSVGVGDFERENDCAVCTSSIPLHRPGHLGFLLIACSVVYL